MIGVGLMCGTSLDGIDAARVALRATASGYTLETQAFRTIPLVADLRARIEAASAAPGVEARDFSRLHADIGDAFARAALDVGAVDADFIASHGVTLAHDGDAHHTLQLGDPFRIREATGRTVLFDFRSADTAAGGQGAPLVPFVDHALFAHSGYTRVALNLGGIANLTILRKGTNAADVLAFDSGPANLPIDTYVYARSAGRARYDRAGAYAAAGHIDGALLEAMLGDPYFAAEPPKSTGRELFGSSFIARFRSELDALTFGDAVATLTALTAHSAAAAIRRYAPGVQEVIVSGGGAHNLSILDGLRAALPAVDVLRSDVLGIDPDAKEAVAFALLGYVTLRERCAGLPSVTGARGPRLLGAIAPAQLRALLALIEREEPAYE